MKQLHPAIRTGLTYAAAHQAAALCGVASAFVSDYVFTLFGIGLFVVDLPVVCLTAILRDAGIIQWGSPAVRAAPAAPVAAILYYRSTIAFVLTLGAMQWFAIGCVVGWRRERRAKVAR